MAGELRRPDRNLTRRLAMSREYWRTEGRHGAPLVLPGADLRDLDLREQVLAEAQLQGADLEGASLDSGLLIRAVLDGARITGASLFSVDASKVSATGAQFGEVRAPRSKWVNATLTEADFTDAVLDHCDLTSADLIRANFTRASMVDSNLSRAILLHAMLADADITGAVLSQAVTGADTLDGAHGSFVGTHNAFSASANATRSYPSFRSDLQRALRLHRWHVTHTAFTPSVISRPEMPMMVSVMVQVRRDWADVRPSS